MRPSASFSALLFSLTEKEFSDKLGQPQKDQQNQGPADPPGGRYSGEPVKLLPPSIKFKFFTFVV